MTHLNEHILASTAAHASPDDTSWVQSGWSDMGETPNRSDCRKPEPENGLLFSSRGRRATQSGA
jgi:hypothetical protein